MANDLANSHWSFGYLMGRIAGFEAGPLESTSISFQVRTSKFILNWLNSFQCDPRASGNGCSPFIASPNGNFTFGRAAISDLIRNWPTKYAGWSKILDLEKAPFRLLSIMSRIDLRNPNQAGEGRFVFGVTDKDGNLTQFTVILEYRLPLSPSNLYPRNSLADWAKRWADLSSLNPNSPQYIEALEKVTDAFSDARFADLPNQSAINQVRSNEIALDFPWQLREWNLGKVSQSQASFQLLPATVKQTPSQEFNNTQALADWANKNQDAILDGSLVLKDSDVISVKNQSRPLLGAFANIDQNWVLPGVKEPVRKAFAVNMTCNGCHSFETATLFTHVSPREKTTVASFSVFLQEDIKSRQSDLKNVLIEEFCK